MAYCYVTKTFAARNKFPHVKVARNTKEVGQAWHKPTPILGRRPEYGSFIRESPLVLTQKGWYCFVMNKTITNFSESKQIYWSVATANTSNIQLVHRHFSRVKCVDPLKAANIFNVHAFLHGICKQGHRFGVVNS